MQDEYSRALEDEIETIKNSHGKDYYLSDGKFVCLINNGGYYQFENHELLNFSPETSAQFTIADHHYLGFIQYCDRKNIEVTIDGFNEQKIPEMTISLMAWRLLESLKEKYESLAENSIISMIRKEHETESPELKEMAEGQEKAFKKCMETPITVIWGPPGTGKTYTLGAIATQFFKQNKKILIVSQSNISVDGATCKIIENAEKQNLQSQMKGRFFRYGMIREKSLLQNKYISTRTFVLSEHPQLENSLREIRQEIEKTAIEPSRLKQLTKKRNDIEKQIVNYEKECLSNARIVATTVTKATIDDAIASQKWDVVFFDEISMAYIPQIYYAASLATQKLILLGDFRQLAPIVRSTGNSPLHEDFFSYIHIVDEWQKVRNHPWLVMLTKQYRMDKQICEFVSTQFYEKKIITDNSIEERIDEIRSQQPFSGSSLAFVDTSYFNSVCANTSHGSKFNLFNAVLSLKLAHQAISGSSNTSIGIITPYRAQAELISSMIRDREQKLQVALNITAATVHQFQGFEKDVIIFDTVVGYPMRQMGKFFRNEDDDCEENLDVNRLIDVAVSRARGKFFLIGNWDFLTDNQKDPAPIMKELAIATRSSYYVNETMLWEILSSPEESIQCYHEWSDAFSVFSNDLQVSNKSFEYFHDSRSYLNNYCGKTLQEFFDTVTKLNKNPGYHFSVYANQNGQSELSNLNLTVELLDDKYKPFDDFFIIDRYCLWANMPKVRNIATGERLAFRIVGPTLIDHMLKLLNMQEAIQKLKKRKQIETVSAKANKHNPFADYIAKQYTCPYCGGSGELRLSKNNRYYIGSIIISV